ncbi:hypothetical protein OCU04_000144 [Sclerotinia nivalis]|uniref:Uncharacterized protein n=1 Tax=Sclerotinia nivalis TaxID=352851 RepID=A0A9X0DPG3_9HELO|nr:hypothetical protein OCU04_000144 [Sclerotinia nivalis]
MFRKSHCEEYSSPDEHLMELIEDLKDGIPDFLEGRSFTQHEIGLIYDMHSVICNQEKIQMGSGGGGYNGGSNGSKFAQPVPPSRGGIAVKIMWIIRIFLWMIIWLALAMFVKIMFLISGWGKLDVLPGSIRWYSYCIGRNCPGSGLLWPIGVFETWGEIPPRRPVFQ